MDNRTIKIAIAEDHEITRLGLKLALDQHPEFRVVAEAKDGEEGIKTALKVRPDVILMDLGMPGKDGIQATHEIKRQWPDAKIIILTSHEDSNDIFAALNAGAQGYCLKSVSESQLALAIQAVVNGAAWLDPCVSGRVLQAAQKGYNPTQPSSTSSMSTEEWALSPREIDVLKLVIDGLTNREIGQRLGLSADTIKTHIHHIMQKMSVADRTQVAVKALRLGLISNKA